jgi:inner membrane protein
MGDFSEHILFGFLSASVISYIVKGLLVLQPVEVLAASLAVVVGAILPDIDHKNSYVHRAVKAFTSIATGIAAVIFLPLPFHQRYVIAAMGFLGVYTSFSLVKIKHRGFTHSISFAAIVTSISVIASTYFIYSFVPGIALGVGLASHLLLDGEFKLE